MVAAVCKVRLRVLGLNERRLRFSSGVALERDRDAALD
jgi:hypothetical protein